MPLLFMLLILSPGYRNRVPSLSAALSDAWVDDHCPMHVPDISFQMCKGTSLCKEKPIDKLIAYY